jgi:hypothetical protein
MQEVITLYHLRMVWHSNKGRKQKDHQAIPESDLFFGFGWVCVVFVTAHWTIYRSFPSSLFEAPQSADGHADALIRLLTLFAMCN